MLQAFGRHAPELTGHIDVGCREPLQLTAAEHNDLRIDDGFGCQPVHVASFEAEEVTGQVEAVDLAPAVADELEGSDEPRAR